MCPALCGHAFLSCPALARPLPRASLRGGVRVSPPNASTTQIKNSTPTARNQHEGWYRGGAPLAEGRCPQPPAQACRGSGRGSTAPFIGGGFEGRPLPARLTNPDRVGACPPVRTRRAPAMVYQSPGRCYYHAPDPCEPVRVRPVDDRTERERLRQSLG